MTKKDINTEQITDHSYFHSLELEGVNCFKERQTLDLSDGKGNYSPWTIILGDNGTGKTTLLRVLGNHLIFHDFYNSEKFLNQKQPLNIIINNSGMYRKCGLIKFNFLYKNKKHYIALNSIDHTNIKELTFDLNKENHPFILSYGASRRMSKNPSHFSSSYNKDKLSSLFDESIELINAQEWYLQKFLAFSTSENGIKIKLEQQLSLIKQVLVDFLPDVLDLRIKEIKTVNDKSALEVQINEKEWINLRDLSFGYQTLTALIVDIASKMMEQYPDSNNPLEEPVVVLIDEIDLHLHPKWQRTVIDKLSNHFPKAQFIATAHSPLIVQVAQDRNANIVVCRKEGDRSIIDNNPAVVKGWRIDQILISDLFEVDSSRSPEIEKFISEKNDILSKSELLEDDKKRLKAINKTISSIPNSTDKETLGAEDIIRRAAELLKK